MSPSMPEPHRASAAPSAPLQAARRLFGPWRCADLLLRSDGLSDGERHWPGFDAWCQAHALRRCRLWLSSSLLHELVCDADLPLRNDAAALAWAQAQLRHYHGEAAAAWALAAWRHGARRGVSVLQGCALTPLQGHARQHRVRLAAVRPWWSLVLARALRRHAVLRGPQARLLVVEGAGVAMLDLCRGHLGGLQLRRLDEATPRALAEWHAEQEGAVGPVIAVGYGLAPGPVPGMLVPEALDGPMPAPGWLGRAAS